MEIKKFFWEGVLMLSLFFVSCGKKHHEPRSLGGQQIKKSTTQPITQPKPFTLATSKVTLDLDEAKEIKVLITSGNGKYRVEPLPEAVQSQLKVSVSESDITITATAKSKLSAEVKITDLTTSKQLTLSVTVLPQSIPHQKNLTLLQSKPDWEKKTKEEQGRIIEGYIETADRLLQQVNALKPLPKDKFKYKVQSDAFADGEKVFRGKKSRYLKDKQSQGKHDYDVYTDIYVYGVGYFTIEYLARQAEGFRTLYPDNQDIAKLCAEAFNGIYGTQEGNEFVHGFNDETIKAFNRIADIVNKLTRE